MPLCKLENVKVENVKGVSLSFVFGTMEMIRD